MSSAVDQPLKHVDQTYLLPEPVIVNSPDENRLSTVRRRGSTKEADTESILSMYYTLYVLISCGNSSLMVVYCYENGMVVDDWQLVHW